MNQVKDSVVDQVSYLGRFVDKKYFRVFVYGKKNEERLATSYDEYCDLLNTKLWFSTKEEVKKSKIKLVEIQEENILSDSMGNEHSLLENNHGAVG